MRIVGGSLRGKRLKQFKGQRIRPTSDRVKEALFNIIDNLPLECHAVLDLFAGTGNLGIEALSRGAERACFVEKNRDSIRLLKENVSICGLVEVSEVIPLDTKKAIPPLEKKGRRFDVIFIDPPYGRGLADETLEILGSSPLSEGALVAAEHPPSDEIKESYGELHLIDRRRYGDTSLSFFARKKN